MNTRASSRSGEPLSRDFSEYHAEAGVVDFRYPTVRLRKCADFFLTRCTRCTFYLFGRPTKFKLTLENHAVFPLLDALSNEFGELVLRARSAGSFFKHILGGRRSTQEQSAEYANINTLYLQKLESGRGHSSLIVLCRLKTALDCARNALLKGSTLSARGSEAVNGGIVTGNQAIKTQLFRFDLIPCSWPGCMWPKHRDSGVHGLKRD